MVSGLVLLSDVQQFVRVETVPQEVLDASAEVRSAAVPTSRGIW